MLLHDLSDIVSNQETGSGCLIILIIIISLFCLLEMHSSDAEVHLCSLSTSVKIVATSVLYGYIYSDIYSYIFILSIGLP